MRREQYLNQMETLVNTMMQETNTGDLAMVKLRQLHEEYAEQMRVRNTLIEFTVQIENKNANILEDILEAGKNHMYRDDYGDIDDTEKYRIADRILDDIKNLINLARIRENLPNRDGWIIAREDD